LKLFEKTINKPAHTDLVPIRISEQLRLEQMDVHFEKYIYQKKTNKAKNLIISI
jgi:hypothetical protein